MWQNGVRTKEGLCLSCHAPLSAIKCTEEAVEYLSKNNNKEQPLYLSMCGNILD